MVDRAIKVAVLEGDFAAICDLGLPFSLSLQLQSSDLKLSEALWTVKSSNTGFSVSLYWPSGAVTEKMKPKKRKHRKRPKASKTNTVTDVASSLSLLIKLMAVQGILMYPQLKHSPTKMLKASSLSVVTH